MFWLWARGHVRHACPERENELLDSEPGPIRETVRDSTSVIATDDDDGNNIVGGKHRK